MVFYNFNNIVYLSLSIKNIYLLFLMLPSNEKTVILHNDR